MRGLAGRLQFINAPMSGAFASFRSSFRITGAFGGDLTPWIWGIYFIYSPHYTGFGSVPNARIMPGVGGPGVYIDWCISPMLHIFYWPHLTCLNHRLSIPCMVTTGMPQSSFLGHVLFVLYVSNLPDAVISNQLQCLLTIDTKMFYITIGTVQRWLWTRLQPDLNNLTSTTSQIGCQCLASLSRRQNVNLNRSHTGKLIPIATTHKLNNSNIPVVQTDSEWDLGVWDSKLTWNRQLWYDIYCILALVRPHYGHAMQIWAPQSYNILRHIERIQREQLNTSMSYNTAAS